MTLNRRDLSIIALGGLAAATAGPAQAFFHRRNTPEAIAQRLAKDMNAAIKPGTDGRFSVSDIAFDQASDGDVLFRATVELQWPPGLRRRTLEVQGKTEDAAYDLLLASALPLFRMI